MINIKPITLGRNIAQYDGKSWIVNGTPVYSIYPILKQIGTSF